MPGNGIAATEHIKRALPDTKVVMLTSSDRDADLFAALRAGADGYLLKTTSAERLPEAIIGVLSGEAALPRTLTARLIAEYRNRGRHRIVPLPAAGRSVELTAREFEVCLRLRRRITTGEIARELGISEVTARRHISSILHKLGARNRQSAIELIEESELAELEGQPCTLNT
jgi:DNA-binding NarL/FixJ family response regulator